MSELRIADNLLLPAEVCTQTLVIFGKRGSGKSSTGARIAEQIGHAKVPFAVLDPPDAWWGIKSSKDGKSEGVKAYIFGGRHADLPLDASNGSLIADVLVDHRVNVVMSLRHFSNLERSRFVIEFADRLFQRNTEPLMLFCEEAHRLMPLDMREYGRGSRVEEMVGKMLKLITEGRTSGIGVTAITQRPAALHSTARNQSEILIAHRIIGPHDRGAIEDWIKYHREEEKKGEVLASLGELKTGDAWVWAPDFPEEHPIGLRRVHFYAPDTFDSRRTPKAGEHRAEPKVIAPVDLEALKDKMSATIEKAKADDPKELRKQIVELKKQAAVSGYKAGENIPAERLQAQYEKGVQAERRRIRAEVGKPLSAIRQKLGKMLPLRIEVIEPGGIYKLDLGHGPLADLDAVIEQLGKTAPVPSETSQPVQRPKEIGRLLPRIGKQTGRSEDNGSSEVGKGGVQRMLIALAQRPGLSPRQLGVRAGLSSKSGTFGTYLAKARSNCWIEGEGKGKGSSLRITEAGRKALGSYEPLPTGSELLDYWQRELGGGAAKMLDVLAEAYPKPITAEELGQLANLSHSSGTFGTYLSRLRTLELITGDRGALKASEEFFE